ncbi:sulfurtransferase TusA family protein [Thermodesulfobacterium hveragerdense]|uniref:sulfurtransferase TusA family protein n=1 Tax=Thermodesulfobacterium hveragerdense TaxID=53424 RepID=UPI0003F8C48C|nr:sulfurtransferase TusA family protein [Thermodesulfobacterium hveragerdense]
MPEVVDARGLSCPEPVLRTLKAIKALGQGELEIWVDNPTAKENVIRAAKTSGWNVVEIKELPDSIKLVIKK